MGNKNNKLNLTDLKETYLIAEIGINHNGNIQIAKKLMDATFACGWNCVKFQKREPDICVPENQKSAIRRTPWGEITYLEYRKKVEFNKKEYDVVDKYCKQKPIHWSASVWDIPSLKFIIDYDVPFIKVPSAKITDLELVGEVAKSNMPVIVSTGMSSLEEVDKCVETITKYNDNFALMHTNSSYPSPNDEINLRVIETMYERYKCTVGYSGHEYGLEPSVIATTLGAKIIERHITLDHDMWGTDQKASIEIEGMFKLKRRVQSVPTLLGSPEKKITESEIPVRRKLKGN